MLATAGMAFQRGDVQSGMQLWVKGLEEMNRAVELAPNSVAVRIPRGATLFEATRQIPDPNQRETLVRLELLFGLADGWARLGDKDKAKQYFERLTADAGGSGRVTYARARLEGNPPASPGRCVGCH